ncbi:MULTISPECIES: hypothetical protein [Leptolyngbya]|uniref:hypothetical protein n=1 Tax=Leptolyngbya TaxID=47251 RepID=UPI00168A3380|nr:hypothetical protein [Leptolyngbya sp. FACHB-1624]MBD1854797.1 hypothetical protein [Leptolyngbya sp. FACHB-1624]
MEAPNASRASLLQAIRVLQKAASPRRTRVLIEQILPVLSDQEFDMLREAIELERLERTYSGADNESTLLSEIKIEIKNVPYKSVKHGLRHRPYIYIRWRDRSHEDLYLGAMLSPAEGISYSYTTQPSGTIEFTGKNVLKLTHKKDQTVRYIRLLSMEPQVFDEFESEGGTGQALLKVEELHPEFLTPLNSPRTYYFPVCMKTQFSKKDWQVEAIEPESTSATKSELVLESKAQPRRFDLSR